MRSFLSRLSVSDFCARGVALACRLAVLWLVVVLAVQPARAAGSGTLGDPFTTLSAAYTVVSGRYYFNTGSGAFQADVDNSEGGGWVLILQYVHDGGTNPALSVLDAGSNMPITSAAALGTDESGDATRWGHAGNAAMSQFTGDIELRWYGETSNHARKIHFRSTVGDAYVRTGTGSFGGIEGNFDLLSGHSANLPGAGGSVYFDRADLALTNFPYWTGGTYHWGVQGDGSRWEMDDFPGDASQDTIHRVWVRQANPLEVTNTNDSGEGSLRQAMTVANDNTGLDAITFAIPTAGPHTITVASALPQILDDGISIDGSTQSGAVCRDLSLGGGHTLMVRINYAAAANGLYVNADDVTLKGLSITGFQNGIWSNTGVDNVDIHCNYVGLAPDGSAAGQVHGVPRAIVIRANTNATIGGTPTQGNVIGASGDHGVVFWEGGTDLLAVNNFIGTDPTGTATRSNAGDGVQFLGAGTFTRAELDSNVISGNGQDGVSVRNGAAFNNGYLANNHIGVDRTGNAPLPNTRHGFYGASGTTASNILIGNTGSGFGNVISANGDTGFFADDAYSALSFYGNRIGVGADGTTALGNGSSGIEIADAASLLINGSVAVSANVISNNFDGIVLGESSDLLIGRNFIGTALDGSTARGNDGTGIVLQAGAGTAHTNVQIVDNVISDNDNIGFSVDSASGVVVRGNYIGTNATGTAALGNGGQGIYAVDVTGLTVGTTSSGNVVVGRSTCCANIWAEGTTTGTIINNVIGTSADGATLLGAQFSPVYVSGTASVRVGDGTAAGANVISNGTSGGIVHVGTGQVAILANKIRRNVGFPIDLGFNGATVNDDGDPDSGPNDLLNFPLLNSIVGDGTTAVGYDLTLDVPAHGAGYRVDFFLNTVSKIYGEGEIHLGAVEPLAPGTHTGTLTANAAVSPGDKISATLTRMTSGTTYDITSEFAATVSAVSALVVTNTNDTGTGSLRDAITYANANTTQDAITFDIPGSGVQTITLASALPAIADDGVFIDGSSQTGATCGGAVDGNGVLTDRVLNIQIDAGAAVGDAFAVDANSVTIKGIVIGPTANTFSNAIDFDGGASGTVICSHLGVAADGTTALPLPGFGIETSGDSIATSVAIGDGTYAGRNVIANTARAEVECQDNGTTCNIRGNYIGVMADGFTQGTGAGNNTVWIGGNNSVVGGPTAPERNVIGLSIDTGIAFSNGPSGVMVENNYIGVAANGTTMLDATLTGEIDGIEDSDTAQTLANLTIRNNVIGGFPNFGLDLEDSTLSTATIAGNRIGVGADGLTDTGIGINGIALGATTNTALTIGGVGVGNVIGFMSSNGIYMNGTTGVTILGNYLGIGSDGTTDVGNSQRGIRGESVSSIQIGAASNGNVIAGNASDGVYLRDANNVSIQGNFVGVTTGGSTALPNNLSGLSIKDSTAITIGGTAAGQGNVISGNTAGSGVFIHGTSSAVTVQGNYIGVGANGTTALGNAHSGIWVQGAATATIGGTTAAAANIIANSGNDGVTVNGTARAAILRNAIYGNGSGFAAGIGIDLNGEGVTTNDSGGGDADSGPNDLLNFPVINSFTGEGTTAVSYDINLDVPDNTPNDYRVDFFVNTAADASGYGQGETHLGGVEVAHAGGDLRFTGSFTANTAVSSGNIISAIVTRMTSGTTFDVTSEFSLAVAATPAADPLIVTSTADTDTPGTLRYAINYANTNPGDDAITFDIAGAGPHTIAPGSTLPIITDVGISIDGSTQSGAVCGQLTTGTPHTLKIHLDLTGAGVSTKAFETGVADVTIKGFSITNAFSHAIQVNAGGDNFVLDCTYIGVEPDGVTKGANARNDSSNPAIRLTGSSNATVRNSLISGNDDDNSDDGLRFENITGGTIEGNIVGLNAAGTAVLGNGDEGILLDGTTSGITIGGTTAATRNVVAGNGRDGVSLSSVSTITLLGNYIGLGVDGVTALGNGVNGISANGVTTLAIGNGGASGRNVIGANVKDGIELSGTIDGVVIDGNTIGLGADGSTARGNGAGLDGSGIYFDAATSDGEIIRNNIISDNGVGVTSFNGSVTNVLFTGNYVGTDATGLLARGNEFYAINPDVGADGWIFGTPASGNVVSATQNSGSAFEIYAGGHTFQNNLIGVGADGTTPLGNEGWGIRLDSSGSHVVGGTGTNEGNIIAHTGPSYASLLVQGGGSAIVSGNTIRDGLGYAGVDLSNSGTTLTFHDNTITGEAGAGIQVNNGTQLIAYNNTITDNGEYGVLVSGTTATAALYANSISGNGDLGIEIAPLGVNANDGGDGDTGPNDLLNYPVINSFTGDGTTAVGFDINLDVPSHANGYRIDFFKNIAADASGHGEGEIHLGSVDVTHTGGNLQFVASFTANASVTAGDIISATATRKTSGVTYDITSEFSANVAATPGADPLIVTSTADTDTLGTLRYAINYANTNPADDAITFNIAGAGPHTIALGSALPIVADAGISIDGTTQSGATCGDLWNGTPHTLKVQIAASSGVDGLTVTGQSVAIKGLSITGGGTGIVSEAAATAATVQCSYIGLAPDGSAAGHSTGIVIRNADAVIGGLTAGQGNVIGSNTWGILTQSASNTSIRGNFIGTDPTGMAMRPNTGAGIGNANGTSTINEIRNNLISGNTHGLFFQSDDTWTGVGGADAVIAGNFIGTDRTGNAPLPNTNYGISFNITTISDFTIGGTGVGDRNVISGNGTNGIYLNGPSDITILGNHIGLGADGSTDVGNGSVGIYLANTSDISIGNGAASGRNLISGNSNRGLFTFGTDTNLLISGNYFGFASNGETPRVNGSGDSMTISGAISNVDIVDNVILGGTETGIELFALSGSDLRVQGNIIGLTASGAASAHTPGTAGGMISGGIFMTDAFTATDVLIGGTGAGEGNTVADFTTAGIWVNLQAGAEVSVVGNTVRDTVGGPGVTVRGNGEVAIHSNSIYGNGGIGIDLVGGTEDGFGVTANDGGDGDTGANELLNYPVINSITGDGTTAVGFDINLDVPSNPTNGYRIDFFKNIAADTSGHGEGEIHLGSVDVAHAGGNLQFVASFTANASVTAGDVISATATRKTSGVTYDITSEFSANVTATPAASPLIVTSTADTNTLGTLRYALNTVSAGETISFNIAGGGVHTITPATALPSIGEDNVTIDGTTQPGATCGTTANATGGITDRDLRIVIDGSSLASGDGLRFSGVTGATVTGMVIGGAPGNGLKFNFAGGTTTILCSHFGVNAAGMAALGNGDNGLSVELVGTAIVGNGTIAGANVFSGNTAAGLETMDIFSSITIRRNFVGVGIDGATDIPNTAQGLFLSASGGFGTNQVGDTTGGGNIISGNTGDGVQIDDGKWVLYGNYIGTDGSGLAAVPNGGKGLNGPGASLTVGNGTDGANVIAGNTGDGLYLSSAGSTATMINGNLIGVAPDGSALGNGGAGVNFYSFSGSNGAFVRNNIIAHNGNDGVMVVSGATDEVAIYANSIHSNTGLGIDLGGGTEDGNGVTANDTGDGDAGANDLLNFPAINSMTGSGTTTVGYDITLDVPAHGAGYRVDFFLNTVNETYGEGETHLGAIEPLAPGTHTGSFTANAAISPGDIVTATTTRIVSGTTYDITSEFALNVATVSAASPLIVTSTADTNTLGTLRYALNTVSAGETISFNIAGGGVHTITPATALPSITDGNVTIDGTTQPGATCGTLWSGVPHTLLVQIDSGSGTNPLYDGIGIAGANATIRGLSITRFENGMQTTASGDNLTVQCSYIGLAPDGTSAGNYGTALAIDGSADTLIGGLVSGQGNVLSGNSDYTILTYAGSTGTMIRGNFLGTDPTGMIARPNNNAPIMNLSGAATWSDITLNLISGNTSSGGDFGGIRLDADDTVTGSSGDVMIRSNYIGVDRTGNTALPNGGDAIFINPPSSGFTIGGTNPTDRNILGTGEVDLRSNNMTVLGNHIGVGADGVTRIAPGSNNMHLRSGSNFTIGDGTTAGRNIIAGGSGSAIRIVGVTNSSISGNYIGLGADGSTNIAGTGSGISISNATSDTTITGNTVTNTGTVGINIASPALVAMVGNSIFNNGGIGINLVGGTEDGNGVTANDSGDGDAGANDLLNYPAINLFSVNGSTSVGYDIALDIPASGNGYRVEFFKTATPDATNGEGEIYLGSDDVSGPGTHTGTFTATTTVSVGESISATVTRKTASGFDITSEFSVNYSAFTANPAELAATKSVSVVDDGLVGGDDTVAIPGSTLRYVITIRNDGAGTADNDTTIVVDQIPPNGSFKVDDFNGSLGVGPVGVADGTPSSGLSYTYSGLGSGADDLEFSNDDGATWTYIPVDGGDGTDSSVTHIRVSPTGSFSANGGSAPTLAIRYDVVLF